MEGLEYNTQRRRMSLPEYGRSVQKMVDWLKTIEDRQKRNEQALAVIKVMEILNPAVHLQENFEQKLWDHLFIMADFDLDVDSPYPMPERDEFISGPERLHPEKKPIKASHYGRNIESILDFISSKEDGEEKTAMIRSLAVYMRQQYLIWNKDSVADETIFSDIEKLSDGRVKVPEGLELSKVNADNFSRPGQQQRNQQKQRKFNNRGRNNRK